jgi:endonuclease YncB( thermonuclease family)
MTKIKRMFLIMGVCFLAGECFAVEEMGQVVDILDGDTLTMETRAGKLLRVRLKEVDAPEPSQTFGRQARQFARDLLTGKSVRVKYKALDRYGRAIGEVVLKDGRVLNRELLSHGLAWHYGVHFPVDESLKELEYQAWKLKTGLWIDSSAVPPWEFRREKNSRRKPPNDPTEMDYNDIFAHGLIGNPATKIYLWPDCPDYPEDSRGFAVFGSVLAAKNSGFRVSPGCRGR